MNLVDRDGLISVLSPIHGGHLYPVLIIGPHMAFSFNKKLVRTLHAHHLSRAELPELSLHCESLLDSICPWLVKYAWNLLTLTVAIGESILLLGLVLFLWI